MNISSLFSKVKNLLLRIRSRLITEYTIMYLYPSIYRKYSEKALDADKVIFIESRLDKLSNSFQVLYQRLGKETDYKLKIHFLRKKDRPIRRTFHKELLIISKTRYVLHITGFSPNSFIFLFSKDEMSATDTEKNTGILAVRRVFSTQSVVDRSLLRQ